MLPAAALIVTMKTEQGALLVVTEQGQGALLGVVAVVSLPRLRFMISIE